MYSLHCKAVILCLFKGIWPFRVICGPTVSLFVTMSMAHVACNNEDMDLCYKELLQVAPALCEFRHSLAITSVH